jgi:hypothetical protein
MPPALTGPELAAFIDELRELLDDGDLIGLGSILRRGRAWDIQPAARDMLTRVDGFRRMDPRERAALGPATMRPGSRPWSRARGPRTGCTARR